MSESENEVPVVSGRKMVLPNVCYRILVVEFMERFAFYGSSLLFSLYMMQMLNFTIATTNALVNAFTFWAYFCGLFGGWLADYYLGKYNCICIMGVSYVIGLIILTISACPFTFDNFPYGPTKWGMAIFCTALVLIGIGMGGIKSNVSVLVADQMPHASEYQKQRIFRWFYWSINAGALFGQLLAPILHHYGPVKIITDEEGNITKATTSYYYSYGLTTVFFVIGMIIFIPGKSRYIDHRHKEPRSLLYFLEVVFKCFRMPKMERNSSFLDRVSSIYPKETIDETRAVVRALLVFSMLPVYWLLYNQLQSSFIAQGLWMQRPSWLTADQLNLVDSIALIILIPLVDKILFPFLRRRGILMGAILRMSIGFVVAALAFVYIGVLQYYIQKRGHWDKRENYIVNHGESAVSIWYQILPYAIIAMSEIFVCVTALEFAYSQAPKKVKSSIMSLYLVTSAVGSALGIAISPVFTPNNMVIIYFTFGGIMFVFAFPFYIIFRHYDDNVQDKQYDIIEDDPTEEVNINNEDTPLLHEIQ